MTYEQLDEGRLTSSARKSTPIRAAFHTYSRAIQITLLMIADRDWPDDYPDLLDLFVQLLYVPAGHNFSRLRFMGKQSYERIGTRTKIRSCDPN